MLKGGSQGWLSSRATTIVEAVGVKRFAIDGAVGAFLALGEWLASQWAGWPLASTPRLFVWITIVGWLLFWWLLNYANQLRIDKLPRMEILFDGTAAPYIHLTHFNKDMEDQAIFVGVRPRALTDAPIRACRGYLNSVMRLGANGEWEETPFDHRQQLYWGAAGLQPALEADIDSETNQALSVFFVKKRDPRIHPLIPAMLNRSKPIFHERNHDALRFEIIVIGDTASAKIYLRVQLGDAWDDIKVSKIDS